MHEVNQHHIKWGSGPVCLVSTHNLMLTHISVEDEAIYMKPTWPTITGGLGKGFVIHLRPTWPTITCGLGKGSKPPHIDPVNSLKEKLINQPIS